MAAGFLVPLENAKRVPQVPYLSPQKFNGRKSITQFYTVYDTDTYLAGEKSLGSCCSSTLTADEYHWVALQTRQAEK